MWWTDIDGFEGHYQVSVDGEMKSFHNGKERILKPGKNTNGYLTVDLYKDGKRKTFLVHRLVAQAFIPNPDNLPEVNHINEDKTDNRVENLEWCSRKYNANWGTGIQRRVEKRSKPVIALDRQGRVVHVFPSTAEAGRNGYNWRAVSACCRGDKGFKTHKGLIWKYQDDFLKK